MSNLDKVLDPLGIKLPNSYIDRMFGSEPLLIEDILARIIKYVQTHPSNAPGFRPKRRAGGNNQSVTNEGSVSNIFHESSSMISASRITKHNFPPLPNRASLESGKFGPSPEASIHPPISHATSPDIRLKPGPSAHFQSQGSRQTAKALLPHIRHQSAALIKQPPAKARPANLPKLAPIGKQEKAVAQKAQLILDIEERDGVVAQLEAVLHAAQQQVNYLEKLVDLKDKKMRLLERRNDPVFHPVG